MKFTLYANSESTKQINTLCFLKKMRVMQIFRNKLYTTWSPNAI